MGNKPESKDFTRTTFKQRLVYYDLVNMENGRDPMTQARVAAKRNMPRSTVSDCAAFLVRHGYLVRNNRERKFICYRRGRNHMAVEQYYETDMRLIGSRPLDQVDTRKGDSAYLPVYRVHLNGGWVSFDVCKEGQIYIYGTGRNASRLFDESSWSTKMKGIETWNGTEMDTGLRMKIRYTRGKNARTFGVCPPSHYHNCDEVEKWKGNLWPFVCDAAKILRRLEKHGGWLFAKDEDGNYIGKGKVTKEYGMDSVISDAFGSVIGDLGTPGISPVWKDRSGKALGNDGEFETNEESYVVAINNLPAMFKNDGIQSKMIEDHERRIRRLEEKDPDD